MPYPNLRGKHRHEAIVSPAAHLSYLRSIEASPVPDKSPEAWILTYQRSLFDWILESEQAERIRHDSALVSRGDARIGVAGRFGFGAPVAVLTLEVLIAAGARRIISIGTAGALQGDLHAGDLVLCEKAIRDEGVSHHYLPAARYAASSAELTDDLAEGLASAGCAFKRGAAWTIDTPFRETVEEARRYRDENVLAVEMEAAALFAVGAVRGVQVACAFSISDLLEDGGWKPQFHLAQTAEGLRTLYTVAAATLAASPSRRGG